MTGPGRVAVVPERRAISVRNLWGQQVRRKRQSERRAGMSAALHPHAGSTRTNRCRSAGNYGGVSLEGDYPLKHERRSPVRPPLCPAGNAHCARRHRSWNRARITSPAGLNIVTVVNSFNSRRSRVRSVRPNRQCERQDQHDGVCVHAGVQAGWTIGERGAGAARYRWSSGWQPSGKHAEIDRFGLGDPETESGDEPLWGSRR